MSIYVLGEMGLLPMRKSKYFNALKTLELNSRDLEGKTLEDRAKILRDAFKKLSLKKHPDKGGTNQDFTNLMDS